LVLMVRVMMMRMDDVIPLVAKMGSDRKSIILCACTYHV
jgi:hypothetical protein